MSKVVSKEFFDRSSVIVAKDLLGKYLVTRPSLRLRRGKGKIDGKVERCKIIETEAYEGVLDKASHAARGQTPRNTPMFAGPGTIYVYFTYGVHYMLNIVCGEKGHPSAVLIRGVEGCVGPGRLTKKLGIDKSLNGKMLSRKTELWIEESDLSQKFKIKKTPRIGVGYAGPVWSKKLYRFILL